MSCTYILLRVRVRAKDIIVMSKKTDEERKAKKEDVGEEGDKCEGDRYGR